MGSACSTGTKDDALVQETTAVVPIVSPHTPESVNKITPINVPSKIALMRLFNDYDLDGNGHIEIAELVQMMTELKRATGVTSVNDEAKTESDAICVMKILDADGNGTLEAEEFVKWVITGLTRPQVERNEVASMSQINRRMDNFLTSVSIVADELEVVGDVAELPSNNNMVATAVEDAGGDSVSDTTGSAGDGDAVAAEAANGGGGGGAEDGNKDQE